MTTPFDSNAFPVKYTADDYARMLDGLLPKGDIWGNEAVAQSFIFYDSPDSDTEIIDDASALDEWIDTASGGWSGSFLDRLLSCIGEELARVEVAAWDTLNSTDPGTASGAALIAWERVLVLPSTGTDAERQTAAHNKLFAPTATVTAAHITAVCLAAGFTAAVDDTAHYDEAVCGEAVCGEAECDGDENNNRIVEITVTAGTGTLDAIRETISGIAPAHAIIVWIDAR